MDTKVAGELGMKRSEQHRALAAEHRHAVVGGKHLDPGPDPLDHAAPG